MTKKKQEIETLLNREKWHTERKKLRALMLDSGLNEDVKWGKLCYSYQGNNVVIIYGLKKYCALGFFKGSLLEDAAKVLVQPGRHSQAMRQLRFENVDEITNNEDLIRRCIEMAIEVENDGLEVDFTEKDNLEFPGELQDALNTDPELAEAFDDLTPGRQRGYVLHVSDAKQAKTRSSRIEKCREKIIDGKGLTER